MSIHSKMNASVHLLKTWATAIPRILYRSTFSLLFDPKGSLKFLQQVLDAQDVALDDPVLGSIDIFDFFKNKEEEIQIIGPYYRSNTSETRLLSEIASLAYLMRVLRPRVIFEIGTFIGRTTRLLAINSPPDCRIFTLDLPQEKVNYKIGHEFLGTPEGSKITQLYGNSYNFDFSNWYRKCDFIWIDGCHDFKLVVSDTQNALKLCCPEGWIAWHDYRHTAWWSGVMRCVRKIHKMHPTLVHVRGTTIAVLPGKYL
ncbi:MAG: class I SAM-dependent methyltransferase [Candidatus Hodarchaeota archaeon]